MKVGGVKNRTNGARGRPKKVGKAHTKHSSTTQYFSGVAVENIYTLPMITPRDYQLDAWRAYSSGIRNLFISWHRRCGKDVISTSIAVDYAVNNPNSSVVLLAPTQKWGRRIFWDRGQSYNVTDPLTGHEREIGGSLLDVCCPIAIRKSTNNTDCRIELHNGSVIQVLNSDEFSFVGMKINCLVISETARHKREIFPLLSPVLEESQGVMICNGTVEDEDNHFWQMMQNAIDMPEEYYVSYLTAEDTKMYYWVSDIDEKTGKREIEINPELEGKINPRTGALYTNINRRLKLGESKAYLIREYLNIPTNVKEGSYYEELLRYAAEDGRISNLKIYDPRYKVMTAWDLGMVDSTTIVFYQEIGDEIRFIDYYEKNQTGVEHYIDVVMSKPYVYSAHFAPHDIKKRDWGSNMNPLDYARKNYNFTFALVPKSNSKTNDIQVVRSYLQRCSFDKSNCHKMLNHLMKYRENPNTRQPEHDVSSHCADAFRYAIVTIDKGLVKPHTLMGNQKELNPYRRIEMQKNVEQIPSHLPIDQSGNFATNVGQVEEWFDGETYIGDR